MNILKSYDSEFVRLGSRSYVQGATITNGLLEAANSWSLGPVERINATFHSLLREQGRYHLFSNFPPKNIVKEGYIALFRVQTEKGEFVVGLKSLGQPVMVSIPYNEDEMIASCEISRANKAASVKVNPGTPVINWVIALNKKLLLSTLPTEGYSQWFLARYNLELGKIKFIGTKLLSVTVSSAIGVTNTKSIIKLGAEPIGSIYFSRKGQV